MNVIKTLNVWCILYLLIKETKKEHLWIYADDYQTTTNLFHGGYSRTPKKWEWMKWKE